MMTDNAPTGNRHGSAVITLSGDRDYVVTRVFDAPAERIFKALTTPELVKRWWAAGDDVEWLVCDIDLRVDGRWRWVFRQGDMQVAFHGDYREISRPGRLVYTEMFEMPGPPPPADMYPVVTTTLDEAGGVTTMTVLAQNASTEQRDAIMASGMETGMQKSYDRLEDVAREVEQ